MEIPEGVSDTPEKSKYTYSYPFPPETKVEEIIKDPPEGTHTGPFKGAVDFVVPLGTDVLVSRDGFVIEVIDKHKKFGPSEKSRGHLNYITVQCGSEFFQVAHLAKGSAKVKKGDFVLSGQKIAETGNSGQMDRPHLHFFVYKSASTPDGFIGLDPKFE